MHKLPPSFRLLASVTLEKREGACALFVQKTPEKSGYVAKTCFCTFRNISEG